MMLYDNLNDSISYTIHAIEGIKYNSDDTVVYWMRQLEPDFLLSLKHSWISASHLFKIQGIL